MAVDRQMTSDSGFTLIEMIGVLAIIALLALVAPWRLSRIMAGPGCVAVAAKVLARGSVSAAT